MNNLKETKSYHSNGKLDQIYFEDYEYQLQGVYISYYENGDIAYVDYNINTIIDGETIRYIK